jgi:hypothetical protein
LEIFNLVGTFWSFAISKQGKWNRAGSRRHRVPRVVRAFLRRTDASAPPLWTTCAVDPPPFSPDPAPRLGVPPRLGHGPCQPRAAACRAATRPRACRAYTWPGRSAKGPATSPRSPLLVSKDELAGFWSSPPAMAPDDYIASFSVFPGSFP